MWNQTAENVHKVRIHVYILFDEHQKLALFAHKKHLSNIGSYSICGFNGLWQFVHILRDAQAYAVHLNAPNQIAIVCFGSRLFAMRVYT